MSTVKRNLLLIQKQTAQGSKNAKSAKITRDLLLTVLGEPKSGTIVVVFTFFFAFLLFLAFT